MKSNAVLKQSLSNSVKQEKTQQWVVGIILTIGGLLVSIPFLWMILSSFKPESEVMQLTPTLLPKEFTFENFHNLFVNMNFGLYLKNTIIVVKVTSSIIF